jgi:glycosyltransferase involved in cell wall biosynthesis
MGRLLHWKGFHLGLQAFARAGLENARFAIIGEGPELGRLRSLARNLHISDRVDFMGRLPREEALAILAGSHVLVHPSLHDSSGWVCIEAMAAGIPVLCLDLGGPATQVSSETGAIVEARTPEQAVEGLAGQMQAFAGNRGLLHEMGLAARSHVHENYRWEVKIDSLARIYASLTRAA